MKQLPRTKINSKLQSTRDSALQAVTNCMCASESMAGLVETAFSIVKPNVVPTSQPLHIMPYYTSIVPLKKAKLDDVKSWMKYLSQPTIDYISSIPELLAGGEDDDEGQEDY